MRQWIRLRYSLPEQYRDFPRIGNNLDVLIEEYMKILPAMNPQALSTLVVNIESLLLVASQKLLMASVAEDGNVPVEKVMTDFVNFQKRLLTCRKEMKFGKMSGGATRETSPFVKYIALVKSFLHSYYYDALDAYADAWQKAKAEAKKEMPELSKIMIMRSGIIIQPPEWEKDDFKKLKEDEA